MIKIEKSEVVGWEAAIRGMRNPMNSWAKSDSGMVDFYDSTFNDDDMGEYASYSGLYKIGPNDKKLMKSLALAGPTHAKYRRMIVVYADITAPLYLLKELDTFKVGTVSNSCSTMHKIHAKEFTLDDFSCEHLFDASSMSEGNNFTAVNVDGDTCYYTPKYLLQMTCDVLNHYRELYIQTKNKKYWWQMIQLLPSSYNQRRTLMLNYEVLHNIYETRKDHKLDEWRKFCEWIEELPLAEAIIFPREEDEYVDSDYV